MNAIQVETHRKANQSDCQRIKLGQQVFDRPSNSLGWHELCIQASMTAISDNPRKTKTMHETLRQIPYGIFAIGVGATPEKQNAFIASWITQCSFEPPLVLFALRNREPNMTLIEENPVFSINLLEKEQTSLARRLVKPYSQVGDKLGQISHFEEVTGAPILKEAVAFLECRVVSMHNSGDHRLVIGEVVNAGQNKEDVSLLLCSDIGWTYAG